MTDAALMSLLNSLPDLGKGKNKMMGLPPTAASYLIASDQAAGESHSDYITARSFHSTK